MLWGIFFSLLSTTTTLVLSYVCKKDQPILIRIKGKTRCVTFFFSSSFFLQLSVPSCVITYSCLSMLVRSFVCSLARSLACSVVRLVRRLVVHSLTHFRSLQRFFLCVDVCRARAKWVACERALSFLFVFLVFFVAMQANPALALCGFRLCVCVCILFTSIFK